MNAAGELGYLKAEVVDEMRRLADETLAMLFVLLRRSRS
jgi:hypothetical protein